MMSRTEKLMGFSVFRPSFNTNQYSNSVKLLAFTDRLLASIDHLLAFGIDLLALTSNLLANQDFTLTKNRVPTHTNMRRTLLIYLFISHCRTNSFLPAAINFFTCFLLHFWLELAIEMPMCCDFRTILPKSNS